MFAIWDTVQFVSGGRFGWINRNKIRTYDGLIWLTVPVLGKNKNKQSIMSTCIDNGLPWQRKHWRSIYINYNKAPYFDKYSGFFEEIYTKQKWEKLTDLNEAIINYLLKALGIKTEIIKCSNFMLNSHRTDLIIDVCKKIDAAVFLAGIHGRDYLDEQKFRQNDIKLVYQNFKHPHYRQFYKPFIENMSVIDLLFNEGENSINIIKAGGKQQL